MQLRPQSLCFTLAALGAVRSSVGDKPTWNYGAVFDWNSLNGTCDKPQQSPVNIISLHAETDESLEHLQFTSGPPCNTVVLESDGTTWVVKYKDWQTCGYQLIMIFKEKKYHVTEVRFHTPSEHSVDGMFFDMEAQIVHTNYHGEQLVVSVLMQVTGKEANPPTPKVANTFLKRLLKDQVMPYEIGTVTHTDDFSLNPYRTIMPPLGSRHYYTYEGSMTTPPCKTGTKWIVMKRPMGITMEQRNTFRTAISNVKNTRVAVGAMGEVGVTLPWPNMLGANARPLAAMGPTFKLYQWPTPGYDVKDLTEGLEEANELYGDARASTRDRSSPSTPYVVVALGSAIVLGFSVGSRLRRAYSSAPEEQDRLM